MKAREEDRQKSGKSYKELLRDAKQRKDEHKKWRRKEEEEEERKRANIEEQRQKSEKSYKDGLDGGKRGWENAYRRELQEK